jgi:hypothetical protein
MSTTMIHGVECERVNFAVVGARRFEEMITDLGYESHVCAMCPNYEKREREFCGPCPDFTVYVPVGYATIIKLALA